MKDKKVVKYIRIPETLARKVEKMARDGRRSFVHQVEMLIEKGIEVAK